jgi:hypothetical protein
MNSSPRRSDASGRTSARRPRTPAETAYSFLRRYRKNARRRNTASDVSSPHPAQRRSQAFTEKARVAQNETATSRMSSYATKKKRTIERAAKMRSRAFPSRGMSAPAAPPADSIRSQSGPVKPYDGSPWLNEGPFPCERFLAYWK